MDLDTAVHHMRCRKCGLRVNEKKKIHSINQIVLVNQLLLNGYCYNDILHTDRGIVDSLLLYMDPGNWYTWIIELPRIRGTMDEAVKILSGLGNSKLKRTVIKAFFAKAWEFLREAREIDHEEKIHVFYQELRKRSANVLLNMSTVANAPKKKDEIKKALQSPYPSMKDMKEELLRPKTKHNSDDAEKAMVKAVAAIIRDRVEKEQQPAFTASDAVNLAKEIDVYVRYVSTGGSLDSLRISLCDEAKVMGKKERDAWKQKVSNYIKATALDQQGKETYKTQLSILRTDCLVMLHIRDMTSDPRGFLFQKIHANLEAFMETIPLSYRNTKTNEYYKIESRVNDTLSSQKIVSILGDMQKMISKW